MIEQERKFILKYLPTGLKKQLIKQAYLMFEKNKHLRVRIIDNKRAYLTFKIVLSKTIRQEYEHRIPLFSGVEMFKQAEYKFEKERYKTKFYENDVDIDIYPTGKQVVEIEFKDKLLYLPDYCGREITGQKKYSNIWIAKNEGIK